MLQAILTEVSSEGIEHRKICQGTQVHEFQLKEHTENMPRDTQVHEFQLKEHTENLPRDTQVHEFQLKEHTENLPRETQSVAIFLWNESPLLGLLKRVTRYHYGVQLEKSDAVWDLGFSLLAENLLPRRRDFPALRFMVLSAISRTASWLRRTQRAALLRGNRDRSKSLMHRLPLDFLRTCPQPVKD
nr:hypothetical protein Iba_chr06cCG10780 [Ipomoea batatas]